MISCAVRAPSCMNLRTITIVADQVLGSLDIGHLAGGGKRLKPSDDSCWGGKTLKCDQVGCETGDMGGSLLIVS